MSGKGLPMAAVSLTVNHGLQDSSNAMAKRCEKNAKMLGVQHLTSSIPWGEPPFPPLPSGSRAFEEVARDARYHLLFQAMTQMSTNTLAFGHHADDQVETALMRLARGTTEIGAGGMRPCRRWGMGMSNGDGGLGWAGYEGMHRWIVRPMLPVSKVSNTVKRLHRRKLRKYRTGFWRHVKKTNSNMLLIRPISSLMLPSAMPSVIHWRWPRRKAKAYL